MFQDSNPTITSEPSEKAEVDTLETEILDDDSAYNYDDSDFDTFADKESSTRALKDAMETTTIPTITFVDDPLFDESDDKLENLPISTEEIAEIIDNQENLPSTTQNIAEKLDAKDKQENLPISTETTSKATTDNANESSIDTMTDDNTKEPTEKSIDESSKLLSREIQKRILDIFNNEIGKSIFLFF